MNTLILHRSNNTLVSPVHRARKLRHGLEVEVGREGHFKLWLVSASHTLRMTLVRLHLSCSIGRELINTLLPAQTAYIFIILDYSQYIIYRQHTFVVSMNASQLSLENLLAL